MGIYLPGRSREILSPAVFLAFPRAILGPECAASGIGLQATCLLLQTEPGAGGIRALVI